MAQQEIEWRARMLEWMLPRLNGDQADKEQFVEMFCAALDKAYEEGTKEAASLVGLMRAQSPSLHLEVAEASILKLAALNARTSPPL